jgi:hypothetical protein
VQTESFYSETPFITSLVFVSANFSSLHRRMLKSSFLFYFFEIVEFHVNQIKVKVATKRDKQYHVLNYVNIVCNRTQYVEVVGMCSSYIYSIATRRGIRNVYKVHIYNRGSGGKEVTVHLSLLM